MVVDGLYAIIADTDPGVNALLKERTLVDIVSACGEVAFGPTLSAAETTRKYEKMFKALIDQYVAPILDVFGYACLRSAFDRPLNRVSSGRQPRFSCLC